MIYHTSLNNVKDSDSDDAFMSAIWGTASVSSKPTRKDDNGDEDAEDDDNQGSAKSRKNTKRHKALQDCADGAAKAKARPAPSANSSSSNPKRAKKGDGALSLAIDNSEKVVLAVAQAKVSFASSASIGNLSAKAAQAIQEKVIARLTPELVLILAGDDSADSGEESRGMTTLASLRIAERCMKAMCPVLEALRSDDALPEVLLSHLVAAQEADLKAAPVCYEAVVIRAAASFRKDHDWTGFVDLLMEDSPNDCGVAVFKHMYTFPKEDDKYKEKLAEFRNMSVIKVVNTLLLVGDLQQQKFVTSSLVEFYEFLKVHAINNHLDNSMMESFSAIRFVATAALEPSLLVDLGSLDRAVLKIEEKKDGVFFKGFCLFPTGQFIANAARALIKEDLQDRALMNDLAIAVGIAKQLKEVTVATILNNDGDISVPTQAFMLNEHRGVLN
jgi:hypothetical protein